MGVRGLTTFIANRSSLYLQHYELHDTYLVIDGNSLASQLYKWHCLCNDCFGGDYDKYAHVIYAFFELMKACNVTPLIVFDGAYEKRKLKTVYSRMKNKIDAAKNLNSVSEGRVSLFPLFLREVFVDIVLKLKVQCVRCDFEGDTDAANLARTLNCPLLSYDSDFYIFDVLYIPFSTMELHSRKKKEYHYIPCEIYKVERFLKSFGGLDKVNLPILAVLLGNDYIKKRAFSKFYRQLKIHKTKQNEQQTQIKSVMVWLKNETPESALRKILGRYKLRYRKRLIKKIKRAISAYQCGNTPICSFFNIREEKAQKTIQVPKLEDIQDADNEEESASEEVSTDEEEEEEEEESGKITCVLKSHIPNFFRDNYRKCLYPSSFMDIISSKTYFCIPQIEDVYSEHSHNISLDIIAAIAKILTFPVCKPLTCVARNEHLHVKRYTRPVWEKEVPCLADIENMDQATRRSALLKILNMQNDKFSVFPDCWQLFLIAVKYWVTNSKNKVSLSYIYSLILCGIILKYVDSKVGFYRSTKSFLNKYRINTDKVDKAVPEAKNVMDAIEEVNLNDSIACMQKLIHYFQMDAKMKSYIKLYDRSVVNEFAQFQSCLLHIKYLNSLLNFPFPTILISDFYDGTFLYNMTTNLQKRSDMKSYVRILLDECPTILNVFLMMVHTIEDEVNSDIGRHEPPKKRRKNKKKTVKDVVPEVAECISEEDGEYAFDANNKYSLLSFMNK